MTRAEVIHLRYNTGVVERLEKHTMPEPRLPKAGDTRVAAGQPVSCDGCGEARNDLELCRVRGMSFWLCKGCLRYFTIQRVRTSTGYVPLERS